MASIVLCRKAHTVVSDRDRNQDPLSVSTYVVCERLSVMHKHIPVHIPQTENFCPNSPESPFLEFQTRKPPPPFQKTSYLRWRKFTLKYPPPILNNFRFEMTSLLRNTPPHFGKKFQIWDDQSLLWNTPPPPPHFGKLQIWDDQSLLWNPHPPFWKTSDLRWPKFTPKYPPPPFWKTPDLRWPKFTPKYHPTPFRKIREIVCGDLSVTPRDTTRFLLCQSRCQYHPWSWSRAV